MAFGERLQEVRRRAGLTQEQFAAELKVSRQAVSKWESCRGYPEIEKILYICNRYQVSLDELFSQEVPREAPVQDAPKAPLPEKTLKTALSAFFANLAPREKWLGIGAVAVTLALALVLGLCLKGGSTDVMTLIWIAAISLVVGGIGVMNIMLVSVTERTREIGLKIAIGAQQNRILWQFLTEAAVLTSLGGILGVACGIGLAYMLSSIMGTPVAISVGACAVAVAFSMIIGVVFGLMPAVKASKLNPIEALRRE